MQKISGCKQSHKPLEMMCPGLTTYLNQVMRESGLVLADKSTNPQEVARRKLARYKCEKCGYLWTDHLRDRAVAMGRWVAVEPVPGARKIGFHLPAILSRAVSLSEILAEKMRVDASDAPALKQQYANGLWALPYRAVEMETREDRILERREPDLPPRTVPGDAVAITAGVDVQKRGFWFTVYAWRADLSSVLIDYGRLTDWDSVHALLHETRYEYESDSPNAGKSLGIWRAGIDSGGTRTAEDVVSRTEEVYNYVRRHGAGRVFACKGASHESHTPVRATSIDRLPSSRVRIPGGLWLYLLDTHYFKSLIFARLEPDAHQPLTLHRSTDEAFAAQIAAESLIRDRNGKLTWVKKSKNNHYLDCTMMAHACVDGAWLPSLQMIIERELQTEAVAPRVRPDRAAEGMADRGRQTELPGRNVSPRDVSPRDMPTRNMPTPVLPARDARPRFMRGRGDF